MAVALKKIKSPADEGAQINDNFRRLKDALGSLTGTVKTPGTPGAAGVPGKSALALQGTHANRSTAPNFAWKFPVGTEFYETDRTSVYVNEDRTGTVSVVGTALTWTAGDLFDATLVGAPISVGGFGTSVTTFTDSTHISVSAAPPGGGAYKVAGGKWIWLTGFYEDVFASRPSSSGHDMSKFDVGFVFRASDYRAAWRWEIDDPALFTFKWVRLYGLYDDVFANRPTGLSASPDLGSDEGFLFYATNRNHTWRWSANPSNFWVVQPQLSIPMQGTISPDQKPSLGANDSGFLFYSTDFDRTYLWTGAAWIDAPEQRPRFETGMFAVDPGLGWHILDGSTVTASKADGTTQSIVLANLATPAYAKLGTSATGVNAASGATTSDSAGTPAGTFAGNLDTTSAPSATVAVQSGAGTTVATSTHTHTVTPDGTFTGTPMGTHSHGPNTLELRNLVFL